MRKVPLQMSNSAPIILIIDDDKTSRLALRRLLEREGYSVEVAACGQEGLRLCHSLQPDVVLTDVVMPGMDGPTLVQRMRQGSPNMKIIFMSGYTEDKLKDNMGENIFFLPKPFTLKQLAAKVKEVLEG